MNNLSTRNEIKKGFPKLKQAQSFEVTSNLDKLYNCIAWAANDMTKWWWPAHTKYWPKDLPKVETVDNFISAFEQLGYKQCDMDLNLESGFEKIVIYTKNSKPTHMARQLESGKWASKLGDKWDIEHVSAKGVEGINYGQIEIVMKKIIIK